MVDGKGRGGEGAHVKTVDGMIRKNLLSYLAASRIELEAICHMTQS